MTERRKGPDRRRPHLRAVLDASGANVGDVSVGSASGRDTHNGVPATVVVAALEEALADGRRVNVLIASAIERLDKSVSGLVEVVRDAEVIVMRQVMAIAAYITLLIVVQTLVIVLVLLRV